jgi:hypothetical protein
LLEYNEDVIKEFLSLKKRIPILSSFEQVEIDSKKLIDKHKKTPYIFSKFKIIRNNKGRFEKKFY